MTDYFLAETMPNVYRSISFLIIKSLLQNSDKGAFCKTMHLKPLLVEEEVEEDGNDDKVEDNDRMMMIWL